MVSVLFISAPSSAEEVSEPTVVLDRFRTALTEGDTEVVKDVLSNDVFIFDDDDVIENQIGILDCGGLNSCHGVSCNNLQTFAEVS